MLAAIGRTSSARFFWIGFCIAGWGYLWVAHWPDEESFSAVPWELQTNGPLLTTKLLKLACDAIHPEPVLKGGFFSVPPTDTSGSFDGRSGLPLAQFGIPVRPATPGPPYDVVLDAFMGTGSTGLACQKLGREFIGIEKCDKYYEKAVQRIEAVKMQGVMF